MSFGRWLFDYPRLFVPIFVPIRKLKSSLQIVIRRMDFYRFSPQVVKGDQRPSYIMLSAVCRRCFNEGFWILWFSWLSDCRTSISKIAFWKHSVDVLPKKRMGNTKVQTNCSPFRAHKHVEREPWNLAWCRFDFLAQGQAKGGHGVSYCFKTIKGSILLEVPLPHGNNWWMIQGHMWQPIDHVPSSILLLISWSNRFGVSPELTSNLVDKERRLCARQLSMTSFFQLLTKNR